MSEYTTTRLARFQIPALAVGVLGAVALIAGLFIDREQFFRAYLWAYIGMIGIALGSLALLSIQYLSGGVWGILVRRNLEAAVKTLPFLALLFIPIALGVHDLYEWSHKDVVAKDPILQWKSAYLNEPFFYARAFIYFLLWNALGLYLVKLGRDYEDSGSPWIALRMRQVSAATLVILGLSLTFASVDWVMSLEPHWFSTMYGISFMVGALLIAHSIALIVLISNSDEGILPKLWKPVHFRDLGNLMLAFVMLWAYTAFCQFLLIWYSNLREEIPWYIRRVQGGWLYLASALLIFQFFVPFFLLLNRPIKENRRRLMAVCIYLLIMRFVDLYWLIMPAFHGEMKNQWIHFAAPIALGGLWLFFYLRILKRRPLIPSYEPYVQEALSHG